MATSTEAVELKALTAQLEWCCSKVPPSVANGSYNLSVDFKSTVAKARRLIGKRGVKTHELTMAVNSFEKFWRKT